MGLMTAASYDDFRGALSLFGAPSQNFVYADVDGHIGYQLPGYIPIRSDPADTGDRPVSGSDGTGEWVGRIAFDDLPRQLDPEPGWIVTANNAAVDADYPAFLGQEWDPGYRAERIIDLVNLQAEDGLTTVEMATIQTDTAPLRARDIVLELDGAQPATNDGAMLNERILDWDGTCVVDSVGCAAYLTWEHRLLRDIYDDELGDLARDYVGSPASWVALDGLLADPSSAWWDDTTTPDVVETATTLLSRALDEAGAELRSVLGNPDGWTWGRLHTATFREATLGESGIGPLEWYFNAEPVSVGGAAGAVNNVTYEFSSVYADPFDPSVVPATLTGAFAVTSGPSYRLVIDMSDLDGARLVTTTGQSGNPFDRHYGDLIDPWVEGVLVPMPFTPAAIDAASVARLTLTP
jgi:penicillin amidase